MLEPNPRVLDLNVKPTCNARPKNLGSGRKARPKSVGYG